MGQASGTLIHDGAITYQQILSAGQGVGSDSSPLGRRRLTGAVKRPVTATRRTLGVE